MRTSKLRAEWAPNVTASELVTDGTFSAAANWSVGTGWSVGNGFAHFSAGVSSNLDQSVTLRPGAWHLLTLNLTVGAGNLIAACATTIGAAITATGNYRRPFFASGGATQLRLFKDTTGTGRVHDISVQVLTTAQIVPNAPSQVGSMFVTGERSVVACGSNLDGDFDPLQIDWSAQEDNQDWSASSADAAGGYTLPSGGRVVRGLPGPRENVVWTTESLWAMRYVGLPNVYDFVEMGRGCGLIGPNAAALVGGIWYWMTPNGAFYQYDGAAPVMIPCTLARDVADNLAWVQGDKVYASRVVGKNYAEVWWFYPDSRDGDEVSRYVIYDTLRGTWSCGTFDRTAYVDASVFQYPLAVDTDGTIWFHEKGFTEDGGPRSWSLTSAFANTPGQTLIINGVRPDADDLQGGYSLTFFSKFRRVQGIFTRTLAALGITSATGEKSVRIKGEQVGFTISGNAAPTFWRMGQMLMDIILNTGKR